MYIKKQTKNVYFTAGLRMLTLTYRNFRCAAAITHFRSSRVSEVVRLETCTVLPKLQSM